jgi:hypothetical protein
MSGGSLEELYLSLRTELPAALSSLSPLVEELERERTRIAGTARATSILKLAAIGAILAGCGLVLLAFVLDTLRVSTEAMDTVLVLGGLALMALAVVPLATAVVVDLFLERQPFFVRYRTEFLPRLAERLGLRYRDLQDSPTTPDPFGPHDAFFRLVGRHFGGNRLRWTALLTPAAGPPLPALAGLKVMEVHSSRRRPVTRTRFLGVVAVGPVAHGRRRLRGLPPGVEALFADGRVYVFVPCSADLRTPDAEFPFREQGLRLLQEWFSSAAQALEVLRWL